MVLLEVQQLPLLEVTPEKAFPSLRSRGDVLPRLPPGKRRPGNEARRLMELTANIRIFRDLAHEMGQSAFAEVQFAVCAEMQPRWLPAGEIIFSAMQPLRSPLLILAGQAALLAQQHPHDEQPEEAGLVQAGECLTNATISWLQPLTIAAVARTDIQLLVLPGAIFDHHLTMPLLKLLDRRERALNALPLLRQCPAAGLRALAHVC